VVALLGLLKKHDAYADKTVRTILTERDDRATARGVTSSDEPRGWLHR
jgi:hypothetical protein